MKKEINVLNNNETVNVVDDEMKWYIESMKLDVELKGGMVVGKINLEDGDYNEFEGEFHILLSDLRKNRPIMVSWKDFRVETEIRCRENIKLYSDFDKCYYILIDTTEVYLDILNATCKF